MVPTRETLNDLPHLGFAVDDLALLGAQHALERRAYVGHRLVDDPIQLDVHAFTLGGGARVVVGPHMEPDDDRARSLGEQDVALRNGADAAVHDLHLHLTGRELLEGIGKRFGRTALVGLDEDAQRPPFSAGRVFDEVLERHAPGCAPALRLAVQPLTALRDLTRRAGVVHHEELVACHRHALDAEDLHRDGRTGLLHRIAPLVEQRPDASRVHAADEVVTHMQRPALHEHRGHRALPGVQLRFDDRPGRGSVGIRLEIEDFRLQENLIEQGLDVGPLLGRDLAAQRLSAELFQHDAVLEQILLDLADVRLRQIDLVDGDDHRHAGVPGVRDRLDGLRHNRVIGGNHEDDDVGNLRTAGAHGRERLVARRVEEGDRLAVGQRHMVGADVLRDAAGFAGHHIGPPDIVEQGRLAVIDVAHDRDHGGARDEIFRSVFLRRDDVFGLVGVFAHRLEAELARR